MLQQTGPRKARSCYHLWHLGVSRENSITTLHESESHQRGPALSTREISLLGTAVAVGKGERAPAFSCRLTAYLASHWQHRTGSRRYKNVGGAAPKNRTYSPHQDWDGQTVRMKSKCRLFCKWCFACEMAQLHFKKASVSRGILWQYPWTSNSIV